MKKLIIAIFILCSTVVYSQDIYFLNHLNLGGGRALDSLFTELNYNVSYHDTLPGNIEIDGMDIFVCFNANPYYGENSMPVEDQIFIADEVIPSYNNGSIHILLFGRWDESRFLTLGNAVNTNTAPVEPASEIIGNAWWMNGITISYDEDPMAIPSIGLLYPDRLQIGWGLALTDVGPPGPCITQQSNSYGAKICYSLFDPSKARDGQNTVTEFIATWIDGLDSPVNIDPMATPNNFHLSQNYPNPFNAQTTIQYSLSEAGDVNLFVYNIAGQLVAQLVNERQEAGNYSVIWNTSDIASGTYFYRIQNNEATESKKMLLLK